jgi:hypothetical protein
MSTIAKSKRVLLLVVALIIGPHFASTAGPAGSGHRPNVLFIVADDLNTRIAYGPKTRVGGMLSKMRRLGPSKCPAPKQKHWPCRALDFMFRK